MALTIGKLGKLPPIIDPRTLQLKKYLKLALPAPPPTWNWSGGITQFGMCLNGPNNFGPPIPSDGLGDCTLAAVTHACTVWRKAAGYGEIILPDWLTLRYYSVFDGYVYGNESTDGGGYCIQVLNDWRNYGYGYRPRKAAYRGKRKHGSDQLLAYAQLDVMNQVEVMQGIYRFGGVYIGLDLPLTAQSQQVWTVVGDGKTGPSAPGSWGGHCVFCIAYDQPQGYIWCITWGQLIAMTVQFWNTYVDEAYALVSPDFIGANGLDPSGFDMATLLTDLQQVTA
jgi:hypothetical protein